MICYSTSNIVLLLLMIFFGGCFVGAALLLVFTRFALELLLDAMRERKKEYDNFMKKLR